MFRVATTTSAPDEAEETIDADTQSGDIPLVSLANKNTAPNEALSDLLTAEARGKDQVIANVKQRLREKTVGFHDALKNITRKPLLICTKQWFPPNRMYRKLSR